jgi:hypothetical protein
MMSTEKRKGLIAHLDSPMTAMGWTLAFVLLFSLLGSPLLIAAGYLVFGTLAALPFVLVLAETIRAEMQRSRDPVANRVLPEHRVIWRKLTPLILLPLLVLAADLVFPKWHGTLGALWWISFSPLCFAFAYLWYRFRPPLLRPGKEPLRFEDQPQAYWRQLRLILAAQVLTGALVFAFGTLQLLANTRGM